MIQFKVGSFYVTKNSDNTKLIFKCTGDKNSGYIDIKVIKDNDRVYTRKLSENGNFRIPIGTDMIFNHNTKEINESDILAIVL